MKAPALPDTTVPTGAAPYQAGMALLLATAIGWGANWTVLKFVLLDWPPLFARGVAGIVAAGGLMLLALSKGQRLGIARAHCGRLGLAAFINVFAWMGFTALALNWLRVAEAALLAYSMPIWATLLAWPIRGERPGARSLTALLLGVSGIVVLMGGPHLGAGTGEIPGVLLSLAAAILFAFGTVTARDPLPVPPIVLTAWQVLLGCIPMVGLSLLFEHPDPGALTGRGLAGMAYMTVGPMALCYLSWFAALKRLPTATAATGMLLVPIVGTITAAVALHEPLGPQQVVAFALTLGGVALALRRERRTG